MNDKFIELLDRIVNTKRLKVKAISDLTGIPYHRINNIKRGSSQANEFDFIQIYREFPEFEGDKENEQQTLKQRLEKIEKENAEMREILMRVLNNQNKILSDDD